ncbi:acid phosphatase [Lelliottia nimipressuralis]|uniref:Acid phosphatase n=1 Tax=Lelliottia nimipressuralis TaxID=69220 RepID=A0ABD4KEX2_9ENTR|nr:phosphatase PAP2 family protein [Lelliottia nimipressuralis]MBF4180411.1 phosphatase PAP2 family protein [Lelliottia nimipressuralis]
MYISAGKRLRFTIIASSLVCSSALLAAENSGFLSPESSPNSLEILPAPPLEGSVAFLNDKANYDIGHTLKNEERLAQAVSDANYKNLTEAFSKAFGETISEQNTPALYSLLQNVLQDSHDFAMRAAKDHYKRVRPFVIYKDHTCTPQEDTKMAKTGSYPSGHASFGWATALVLSEINPARETEILKRGYEFGQSRVICGAHWQSDVDSGRIMGAAVVASLHSNSDFISSLTKAKEEFRKK